MIKGCEVDPALVYDDEPDDIPSNTGGGGGGRTGSGSARPTEQQDGANVTESGKKSLYRLISESHVEVCVLKHCYVGHPRYTIRCVAKHTYFYIGATCMCMWFVDYTWDFFKLYIILQRNPFE